MQTRNAKLGSGFWLRWVLASILGFGAGAGIGKNIANSISITCTQSSSDSLFERLINVRCILPGLDLTLLVVVLGLAGGFMQWSILRRHIAKVGWWILANALGFPIALVIAVGAGMSLGGDSLAAPILMGVVFGVLSGILPWLVLRRQVARAGWWILAHCLGSVVGGALGITAFHVVGIIGYYPFSWATAGAMFGAGLGAITGIALVWFLRHSVSDSRLGSTWFV